MEIKNWGGHTFEQPGTCSWHEFEEGIYCAICDGLLQWCTQCNEGEGGLMKYCPSQKLECYKLKYSTREDARRAMEAVNHRRRKLKKEIRVYRCDRCPFFHTTSEKKR